MIEQAAVRTLTTRNRGGGMAGKHFLKRNSRSDTPKTQKMRTH